MDILDHGGMRGGRGIPGLDIWDNLDPHITLVRVLSPVSTRDSVQVVGRDGAGGWTGGVLYSKN